MSFPAPHGKEWCSTTCPGWTLSGEVGLSTAAAIAVADRGKRVKSGFAMVAATPIRLISMGVDLVVGARYLTDLATGNRNWRK